MSLKDLYQKVLMKKNLELKLKDLYSQRNDLKQKESELSEKMFLEQEDVDRLEQGGIASFFYDLIGRKEEKLEQERQEVYEIKSKYNAVVFQLVSVEKDISRLEIDLKEVTECEMEYQRLMNETLSFMKTVNPQIIELEKKIIDSQLAQKEIAEAKRAGKAALNKALEALSNMDSASGWSTVDLLGGGLVSDVMKYAKLNEAEQRIQELQVLLGRLKTELADVQLEVDVQIQVGEFLMMADFFFDNLFTDYAVRSKISNAKEQLNQVIRKIERIISQMDELLMMQKKNEKDYQSQMEQIAIQHQE